MVKHPNMHRLRFFTKYNRMFDLCSDLFYKSQLLHKNIFPKLKQNISLCFYFPVPFYAYTHYSIILMFFFLMTLLVLRNSKEILYWMFFWLLIARAGIVTLKTKKRKENYMYFALVCTLASAKSRFFVFFWLSTYWY